jgi:hypothetical protein
MCTHCIHSFAVGNLIWYPPGLSIWCVDFLVETKIHLKVLLFKVSTHAPGYWGTLRYSGLRTRCLQRNGLETV